MGLSREELERKHRELPLRAVVTFALRCAKRVEPLRKYRELLPEAYSAGVDLAPGSWFGRAAVADYAVADYAAASAAHAADAARYAAAPDASYVAYAAAANDDSAADSDIEKLLALNLGRPGERGEPIRWNDPRLGPLWPDGEPEWYVEAQKACRELEEKLANLPDPSAAPIGLVLAARLDNVDVLDRMWAAGKLAQYKGEYIVSDGETVFAHGRNLVKVWEKAEKKVKAAGKDIERFNEYYVM